MRPRLLRALRASVLLGCVLVSSAPAWGSPQREAVPALQARAAPEILEGPFLRAGPDPNTPNVAVLELVASVPVRVRLDVFDGTTRRWITPPAVYRTHHSLPVLGLRADRPHLMLVEVRDASGATTTTTTPLSFRTPPLPAGFPPLETKISTPVAMEPGLTLFNATPTRNIGTNHPWIVAVDETGAVVWYHRPPAGASDLRRLRNGNLLYVYEDKGLREIDLLGNVVAHWWASNLEAGPAGAIPVATDTIHHEVHELPEAYQGDFLALSTELRVLPDYPTSELDPTQTAATANVIGDVVVEFRRDGSIVREWKLLDVLDPYRITYDTLSPFWDSTYGTTTVDWSHANAVVPLLDGSIVVSLRHQDAVVGIDGATGTLRWILGDPGRWVQPWASKLLALEGAGSTWSYHTHAPALTPGGRMLLFDNGVFRAIPPAPQLPLTSRYSRAVEYAVDPLAGTAEVTWSDEGGKSYYSSVVGDADPMPRTGNVLVTSGSEEEGPLSYSRIFEVERSTGDLVFELYVSDDPIATPTGWLVYRAERIPGLYSAAEPRPQAQAPAPTKL